MTDVTTSSAGRASAFGRGRGIRRLASCALGALTLAAVAAGPAAAAVSYAPGTTVTPAENPVGLAVDQTSGNLYAAQLYRLTEDGLTPGQLMRFDSAGAALSPYANSNCCYFSGVAVNPTNQHVYAYNAINGVILTYDAAGTPTGNFTVDSNFTSTQHLATGPTGSIYFPNQEDDTVEVFSAAGGLLGTISGTGPNALSNPTSVVVNSAGDVFVADAGNNRVLKFPTGGGTPVVAHAGAAQSVALDRSSGELFVLGNDGGGFHVTLYDAAGTELDDFGVGDIPTGTFPDPGIAVDEDDGTLYVANDADAEILTFDREETFPPEAVTGAATVVTKTTATLNGTVDPNESEVTAADCEFEYVNDAQFDQDGFASATSVDCSSAPGSGAAPVAVSAAVTGLAAGTEYHVRLGATSAGGSDTGDDQPFTTVAETVAPSPDVKPDVKPDGALALNGKTASYSRGKAAVKVKCSGGACKAGKITLKAKIKSGKQKAKTVTIGTASIKALADGGAVTVKVTLSRKAKGALGKTGKLTATVSGAAAGKVTIKGGKKKSAKRKRG